MSLPESRRCDDRAARIYRQLKGARGMDDAERWQHALFFAMSPQERCHFSLKTARSALREKDTAVLPILRRTLRLAERLEKQRARIRKPVRGRKRVRSTQS
jgi:hypothetical protein